VTIRAAIVGLGRWGRRLVDSVQDGSVARSTGIRFVGGWTRTAERAREFASARGFELAPSFQALLDDEGIDAIVLATPLSQHVEQVLACARAGKAVYVEKPLALTHDEALLAARACAEAGTVLAVGHNRRFLPAMRALFEMAAAGELGQLLHVEGNFSGPFGFEYDSTAWRASANETPAGGLTLMGVHILDAMIALMGPVESVSATSLRQVLRIELDDTSSAVLRFASKASGYVSTLTATPRLWRLQVFGTRAWAHVLDHEILEVCKLGDTVKRRTFAPEDAERTALEHFAAAVRGDAPFPVALPDVLNGIAALEAFVESARRGGKVTALPVEDSLCFQ
jgi:myo-inositol 2-dehydrogenase/D-chiro-inositol 1-dehydrogenase